ncbi:PREDICTED: putative glycerol-3-phosphate transporter 2 [Tarenaya hassleriana]|uniref:putative glycerol-3-phosphate transporter 2 n=1 Tax=Tarenaya hassleriana TaxID=28532 RepID=UPI00053C5F1D|nr:PREDICTED: putative glycerol-3-phosphate transporter 2 [Tarenaya hassleriana]
MSSWTSSRFLYEETKPWGIQFLERFKRSGRLSFKNNQAIVFVLTFVSYVAFHASRKPNSIVKGTLTTPSNTTDGKGWAPFDGPDGPTLLGQIDLAFLSVYAVGMFVAGHLGDMLDLRTFLTTGMIGTGVFTALFGFAQWANIHSFYYFLADQTLAGWFQSIGWPCVVALLGNWFDKRRRGMIMGIWSAHTSLGNIIGSLIAAGLLKYGWGWSFAGPALLITFLGIVVYLFVPVNPYAVGAERDGTEVDSTMKLGDTFSENLLISSRMSTGLDRRAVGFWAAWRIPGVTPFAFCLFFTKLVSYTFLYWLPFYVSHTEIGGEYLSEETAGNLSTLFDVGGVVGGILAGYVSDQLDARAITAAGFIYLAIPALFLYRIYGHISMTINLMLMFITGVFVIGPFALITTAVSADLGTHKSLKGNARALATVTAIIDGTGSIGAAIGPVLTGYISAISWSAVFYMLMAAALISGLLLTQLVITEVQAKLSGSTDEEAIISAPVSRPPIDVLT